MFKRNERRLMIIGGAADKCYLEFLNLAGGKLAHIVVLGHASGQPRQAAEAVKANLQLLGAANVSVITPRSPRKIESNVDAIFMAGGDQSRLVKLLDRDGLSEQIRDAKRRGVLIGGTSAGAAACAPTMIAGGMGDGILRRDSLLLEKGLSLLPHMIIDTHFAQRNRYNRLRAAVASLDSTIAVGLNEDTALVIEGNKARIVGVGGGGVYVCSRDSLDQLADWEGIAKACNMDRFASGQSLSLPLDLETKSSLSLTDSVI